jgi:hypothetical protein
VSNAISRPVECPRIDFISCQDSALVSDKTHKRITVFRDNIFNLSKKKKEKEKNELPEIIINTTTKSKCSASSVNRTRASSMATTNSTTRPMMLVGCMVIHNYDYKPPARLQDHSWLLSYLGRDTGRVGRYLVWLDCVIFEYSTLEGQMNYFIKKYPHTLLYDYIVDE